MKKTIVIMGVSGSGKTTVGKLLAEALQLPFYDADDFHPQQNIEKMSAGKPLNDEDRAPWLQSLNKEMRQWKNGGILACSALKESYRETLSDGNTIQWIYLEGDFQAILQRMQLRDHFMKPKMLKSQFDTLEPPSYGIKVTIDQSPEEIVAKIITTLETMETAAFGIIGMGVMGRSLAKNLVRNGYNTSVYNRYTEAEKEVIPSLLSEVNNSKLQGFTDLPAFVSSLQRPRKILLMIPSGKPVDMVLEALSPLLDKGDMIMDGGNSHYKETQRREQLTTEKGLDYLGIGISGGEEGALWGPSMMVGGPNEGYNKIKVILEDITAKDFNSKPCVSNFGTKGAGHFIKTIHNGIEYAEMQLLAEVYALLHPSLSNDEISNTLQDWNLGDTQSFLLETTIQILRKKESNSSLLDKILDVAASKGTGSWSSITALEQAYPATMLIAAVMARAVSTEKSLRKELSNNLELTSFKTTIPIEKLKQAYQFARILNHQQGLQLIETTAKAEGWDIDLAEVVRVWTNGCILKSEFLKTIHPLLQQNSQLLHNAKIQNTLKQSESSITEVISLGMEQRTYMPCMTAALQYWYGITSEKLSANLIQAQRDAFGAHTYKRIDKPEDQSFTTNWKSNG